MIAFEDEPQDGSFCLEDEKRKGLVMQDQEAIFVRVRIDQDEDGLLTATSPNMAGLFVVDRELPALIKEVPQVIIALLKAEKEHDFEIWRTRVEDPEERAWVAIPAHIAHQASGPQLSQ